MSLKRPLSTCRTGVLLAVMCGLPPVAMGDLTDPADPNAAVPPTEYRSVFDDGKAASEEEPANRPSPWRRLFNPDGSFVPEDGLARDTKPDSTQPAPDGSKAMVSENQSPPAPVPGESDARGIIKAIDIKQAKVKLKHGPIDKLGMPGMTMKFRVDDPSLLNTVKEGDEVGFTIEMQGSAFVVTGFQR